MSYILDALKKAEHERDLGRVPRLESVQDNATRHNRVLPWLIAGVLLVNAAVLIWWLRPGASTDVATAAAPIPSTEIPAVPATPGIQTVAPPAVSPPQIATVPAAAPITPAPPVTMPEVSAPVAPPVAAPVEPMPVVAAPIEVNVPLLRDMPATFRAGVPALSLDVHVYAPNAANRFVLMNMKKYREGDQTAEGPRIEEITEEGVVLNYQGQQFRIARP